MEPSNAVSLASSIIQTVEYSAKVVHKGKVGGLHGSDANALKEPTLLDDAIANLADLSQQLRKTQHVVRNSNTTPDQHNTADAQLIACAKDGAGVAKILQATLDQAKRNHDVDEQTVLDHGLRSVLCLYYNQKTISAFLDTLNSVRKQVDIALLASLKKSISQLNQAHLEKGWLSGDKAANARVQLLYAVNHHNWKPTETADISSFSDALKDAVVSDDIESRFASMILAHLRFTGLPDRLKAIPCTHPGTFQWTFDGSYERTDSRDYESFPRWLAAVDGSNLYWVSGEPGAGKSTLMKFLSSHRRTAAQLQTWAKAKPVVKGRFFSSSLGNNMQKSRLGLLQTLLYCALKRDRKTLLQVFHHRWQQFRTFGGGRQPFTWNELRYAFIMMVSTPLTPRSFFFAIDGLDELDGDPKKLVQFLTDVAKFPQIKLCVASRPTPEFLRIFKGEPCLRLERCNRQDIHNYVKASFIGNEVYANFNRSDPGSATNIIKNIAKKAAGIFLWAYVVVNVLLDGLVTTARIHDLVAQLESLPSGLEQLFTKLIGSLNIRHLRHACQLFRLFAVKTRPMLLELWFADCENDDPALRSDARPLARSEILVRLGTMKRQLNSRCRGLLEVESSHKGSSAVLSEASHVTWTHSIARDFVRSQRVWNIVLDNTGHDAFDPQWHWANGQLGLFKTLAGTISTKTSHFASCIEYALRLEHRLQICPIKFLDELGRTAAIYSTVYGELIPRKLNISVENFLDFAVLFNLTSYVRTKGVTLPREDLVRSCRLLGLLDVKQWEVCSKRFGAPAVWNADFEEMKREMERVMNGLLDRGSDKSRWERAKKRLSRQRKT